MVYLLHLKGYIKGNVGKENVLPTVLSVVSMFFFGRGGVLLKLYSSQYCIKVAVYVYCTQAELNRTYSTRLYMRWYVFWLRVGIPARLNFAKLH